MQFLCLHFKINSEKISISNKSAKQREIPILGDLRNCEPVSGQMRERSGMTALYHRPALNAKIHGALTFYHKHLTEFQKHWRTDKN